jgi:hypothetical protein
MTPPRLLKPGRFSRTYATTAGTSRNLVDDGDALLAAMSPPMPVASACARRIRVGGAGTLEVQYSNGIQDTLTCLAGETFDAFFAKILSGTATNITVWW